MSDILWIAIGVFIGLVIVFAIILFSGNGKKSEEKVEKLEPKKEAEKKPEEVKAEPAEEPKVLSKKEEKPADKKASSKKPAKAINEEPKEEKKEEEEVEEKEENQTYRIVYDKEQKNWIVRIDGGKRASRRCKTKEEALKVAKELAKKKDADLSIHKKNGKFQKQ